MQNQVLVCEELYNEDMIVFMIILSVFIVVSIIALFFFIRNIIKSIQESIVIGFRFVTKRNIASIFLVFFIALLIYICYFLYKQLLIF